MRLGIVCHPAYGGSGVTSGAIDTDEVESHGFPQSILVVGPPLGATFFAPES